MMLKNVVATLLEKAAAVSTPFNLAAFGLVVLLLILWVARSESGKRPLPVALLVVAIGALVTVVLAPMMITPGVYHVRATVVGPNGVPVEDAKVWSSIGGEAKKVSGGWQFDVPAGSVPRDGKLAVYATVESAFLSGLESVQLGSDYNLAVRVTLTPGASARVRGLVVDASGRGVVGVRVNIVGYQQEAVLTAEGGGFDLPSHAADGQQVQVHAEKDGYQGVTLWHPAGNTPAEIKLVRQ